MSILQKYFEFMRLLRPLLKKVGFLWFIIILFLFRLSLRCPLGTFEYGSNLHKKTRLSPRFWGSNYIEKRLRCQKSLFYSSSRFTRSIQICLSLGKFQRFYTYFDFLFAKYNFFVGTNSLLFLEVMRWLFLLKVR